MSNYKFIYYRRDTPKKDGKTFANIHYLVGYCPNTITEYQKMADEMRKTFPQIKDKDVRGGKVFKSSFADGFTIVAWDGYIEEKAYPGWTAPKPVLRSFPVPKRDNGEGIGFRLGRATSKAATAVAEPEEEVREVAKPEYCW